MSNFICSECGMNNIDCGGAGYKTPKEIELEKENEKLKKCITELKVRLLDTREARDNATKVANTYLDQIADLSKKVKTLRGLLEHAQQTMGQIAKLSEDKVDAIQCATSICLIQERLKEMEGVK